MRSRVVLGVLFRVAALMVVVLPMMAQGVAQETNSTRDDRAGHDSALPPATASITIPPGDLKAALDTLSKQTGTNIIYRPEHVQGLTTPGVSGDLSTVEAVNQLLVGTKLTLSTDSRTGF